jgi:hypothetical protein
MDEDEFDDSMRIEWAKARARMMRWKEELWIVQEVMCHVIAYHGWMESSMVVEPSCFKKS